MTLPTGIAQLDRLFMGGLSSGRVTHVFGEAASGKTTLALQFMSAACHLGVRSILVNSEPASPIERFEQITGKGFHEMEDLVRLLSPKDFDEQGTLVDDLELYARDGTGLIVIDTLTRLYRAVLEDRNSTYAAHRELNRQAGVLKGLARHRNMAVLILNQVRGRMGEESGFEPVAKNIMEYWQDNSIRIHIGKSVGERILERLIPEGEFQSCNLFLTPRGLETSRDG